MSREPEAILRDLVRAQDALLRAYRLGDSYGASAADRCRELREELGRADEDPPPTLAEAVEVIEALAGKLDADETCSCDVCEKSREFLARAKGRHGG